jgi:hypothetical protein
MSTFHRTILCLLLLLAACNASRPAQGPLTDFEFLEGRWAETRSSGVTEELWTNNRGWSMLGVGRALSDGAQTSGQELSIEPRGSSFVYVLRAPGAAPVELPLAARGATWVRFEDPSQDFPRRVEYRRDGNVLRVEVSGVERGIRRTEVHDFRRIR